MLTAIVIITILDAFWLSVLVFDTLPRMREKAKEQRGKGNPRATRPSG